jgi:hypothetical protein
VVAGAIVEVVESAAATMASRVERAIRLNFILRWREWIEEERIGPRELGSDWELTSDGARKQQRKSVEKRKERKRRRRKIS